jgi:hypothetical protein
LHRFVFKKIVDWPSRIRIQNISISASIKQQIVCNTQNLVRAEMIKNVILPLLISLSNLFHNSAIFPSLVSPVLLFRIIIPSS